MQVWAAHGYQENLLRLVPSVMGSGYSIQFSAAEFPAPLSGIFIAQRIAKNGQSRFSSSVKERHSSCAGYVGK